MARKSLLRTEKIKVKRILNDGEYDSDGYPKKPRFEIREIEGNVQPVTGKELLEVPEGDRERQIFNVFSKEKLNPNDIVIRNNIEYEVRLNEDWNQGRAAHNFARIIKKDV